MIERTLVVDDATGAILRKLAMPPAMLALNVTAGESLFVVTDDDGLHIADDHIILSEEGVLVATPEAPETLTLPSYDLQYVAV